MKKIKLLAAMFALTLGVTMGFTAQAEESNYIAISNYTETFRPAQEQDASLTVEVAGTAGEDGYLYLLKNVKDMELVEVTGENIQETAEVYTQGSISYYRVAVTDQTAEASVKAIFHCPRFYSTEMTADDNGGNTYTTKYSFTNHLTSAIGKYTVYVYAPENMAVVKVTAPAKYANQLLGEENGMRYVGATGKLAPAASTGVTFTYHTPMSGAAKVVVWVLCLGIGAFVFVDRYKKVA